jgi:hypothetical protein
LDQLGILANFNLRNRLGAVQVRRPYKDCHSAQKGDKSDAHDDKGYENLDESEPEIIFPHTFALRVLGSRPAKGTRIADALH